MIILLLSISMLPGLDNRVPLGVTVDYQSRFLILNNWGPRSRFPVLANNQKPPPDLHP
jgi:hypothetical protein